MLKNYIDEDYLKGLCPELNNYLWRGEEDYSKQKITATQIVFNDLKANGYNFQDLMSPLMLANNVTYTTTTTGTVFSDTINRLRLGITTTAVTGSHTVTLQGANDTANYFDIDTVDISAVGTQTILYYDAYRNYRIIVTPTTGSVTLSAFLVETVFDLLFAYKWLYLILNNAKKTEEDQFAIKANDIDEMYSKTFDSARFFLSRGATGSVNAERGSKLIYVRR